MGIGQVVEPSTGVFPTRRTFHQGEKEVRLTKHYHGRPEAAKFLAPEEVYDHFAAGALIELPALFIFTYDAMGDGEDEPTHQPVVHLASLRAIPGLVTMQPGDANEVVEAYCYIMQLRVGASGRIIGMETFGASAPLREPQRKFRFEPDRVVLLAKELVGRAEP